MAELVGIFATSHGPLIAREWDRLSTSARDQLNAGFGTLAERINAMRPDVLVIVSPDHWVNFFLNNMPAFCVGIGDQHDGPPEPFLKPVFKHEVLAGDAALGRHIVDTALGADFDPSSSYRLTLDHGFCIPLWRLGLDPIPPIVPIVVNDIESPMPTIRRCLAWGRMLRQAIETFPQDRRVAILATGGLSHFIGVPGMGHIDERFDRICIDLFENAPDDRLAEELQRELLATGNGGEEVRNWVVAHAAAGSRGFELVGYAPLEETYVGCAFAEWRLTA